MIGQTQVFSIAERAFHKQQIRFFKFFPYKPTPSEKIAFLALR
jgi:hypothetical protein